MKIIKKGTRFNLNKVIEKAERLIKRNQNYKALKHYDKFMARYWSKTFFWLSYLKIKKPKIKSEVKKI